MHLIYQIIKKSVQNFRPGPFDPFRSGSNNVDLSIFPRQDGDDADRYAGLLAAQVFLPRFSALPFQGLRQRSKQSNRHFKNPDCHGKAPQPGCGPPAHYRARPSLPSRRTSRRRTWRRCRRTPWPPSPPTTATAPPSCPAGPWSSPPSAGSAPPPPQPPLLPPPPFPATLLPHPPDTARVLQTVGILQPGPIRFRFRPAGRRAETRASGHTRTGSAHGRPLRRKCAHAHAASDRAPAGAAAPGGSTDPVRGTAAASRKPASAGRNSKASAAAAAAAAAGRG